MMWRLKSCPHCGGDTFIDKDEYSWYEQCLQCGYNASLKEIDVKRELAEKDKKPIPAG
jgi:DNA-directed RNA polymerase subunit M/transcription elongation factor TFIIS